MAIGALLPVLLLWASKEYICTHEQGNSLKAHLMAALDAASVLQSFKLELAASANAAGPAKRPAADALPMEPAGEASASIHAMVAKAPCDQQAGEGSAKISMMLHQNLRTLSKTRLRSLQHLLDPSIS